MRISNIKQTSPERYLIILDNGTEIKSTLKVITDEYLYSDLEIDQERLIDLKDKSEYSLCELRAMRLIGIQPMSKKGLYDKLIQKGEYPIHAEKASNWLEKMGLINDESYAGMVVRHYTAKGFGVTRIKNELYKHGVPKDLWDDAIKDMPDQQDKIDHYLYNHLDNLDNQKQLNKVKSALLRRGFSWSDINNAIERYKEEYEDK